MLPYSQQFTYQIIILVSKSNLLCLLCANHTEHATEPSTQRLLPFAFPCYVLSDTQLNLSFLFSTGGFLPRFGQN